MCKKLRKDFCPIPLNYPLSNIQFFQSCFKMARAKMGAILLLTFHFLLPTMTLSEIPHFDGFFRQIRILDVEATPTNPKDFIMHAEMALHTTGKILTLIDWSYETNLTDTNKKSKIAFKVCTNLSIARKYPLRRYYLAFPGGKRCQSCRAFEASNPMKLLSEEGHRLTTDNCR